jgi:hypothetical protein
MEATLREVSARALLNAGITIPGHSLEVSVPVEILGVIRD